MASDDTSDYGLGDEDDDAVGMDWAMSSDSLDNFEDVASALS